MSKRPHNAPDDYDALACVERWRQTDAALVLDGRTDGGQPVEIGFQWIAPSVWRMTFRPYAVDLPPTPILPALSGAPLPITVTADNGHLTAAGGALTLQIGRDPWRMSFTDADGFDVLRDNPTDIDGLGRPFVLPLGLVGTAGDVRQVTASFHLRPDEYLFGLGEKFMPVNKRGQRIITWTQDAFGSTSERSHKNIPFLISTRGYGLLFDSGARITWDLGVTSCQSYTVALDAPGFDAYIIAGKTPADILEIYTGLTGRSPVPPKWTFGLWVSSGGTYRDQAAMERLIDGLAEHEVPADVVHLDPWWMKWRTYCDFRWDREAFPDVEGFLDRLHGRGLKLCLWEHPYISVESDLFAYGREHGYFLTQPDGEVYIIDYGLSLAPRPDGVVRLATPETSWNARVAIVDLTHPDAYTWFQDLHRPLLRMGVDIFKTDFGEDVPADAVFHNGQTGAQMHNLYPLLYNRCVYEVTAQERGRAAVWSRAATAGSQRYPVCWSGDPAADFDSLACTIRGGLSAGFSGMALWSSDIGAYRGMPSARLYVRWAQFCLLCSHSRMHGDSPREPWVFGGEALAIVRDYVRLRYRLFPYLYSLAHEAARTGLPVIRALALAFPDDPGGFDQDLQFMLGTALLVAPVYDDSDARRVYLPPGAWVDFWSGETLHGPAHVRVDAPLDRLPLYVRAGSIVPMMPPAERIPDGLIDPLILDVYPAAHIACTLHEDEGSTVYEGTFDAARLTLRWSGGPQRAQIVRLHGVERARAVTFDGAPLTVETSADGVFEVHTPRSSGGLLVVECIPPVEV